MALIALRSLRKLGLGWSTVAPEQYCSRPWDTPVEPLAGAINTTREARWLCGLQSHELAAAPVGAGLRCHPLLSAFWATTDPAATLGVASEASARRRTTPATKRLRWLAHPRRAWCARPVHCGGAALVKAAAPDSRGPQAHWAAEPTCRPAYTKSRNRLACTELRVRSRSRKTSRSRTFLCPGLIPSRARAGSGRSR